MQLVHKFSYDLESDNQIVTRAYQCFREFLYYIAELESKRLSREIEMDELYFGGRCKEKCGKVIRKISFLGFWRVVEGLRVDGKGAIAQEFSEG